MQSTTSALADALLTLRPAEDVILGRIQEIHQAVLSGSAHIRQPNFIAIDSRDLDFLFRAYDEAFFGGLYRKALEGRRLIFRLSSRMTHTGGKTTQYRLPGGEVAYEIAIASSMLFDSFREADRRITACGVECVDRLNALQRIFEHELVHLGEQLCWGASDCSAGRFQEIASRLFLHRAHTHNLITRRERAADSGIHVGSLVMFTFEGRRLSSKRLGCGFGGR